MPLYEYSCKTCGLLEIRQSITDAPIKKCPQCSKKVVRLISVTGEPQFKGKGFYKTDYKKIG